MYVATEPERAWLLSVQRMLYTRSRDNLDYVFRKLWGFITDPRNLRIAFARVARNRGRRTAGVDRVTVRSVVCRGVEPFIEDVRKDLRDGKFMAEPVRRVLIPKLGQPGKFRPLGIPTVRDRVVQAAVKNILEPVFEADFFPCSNGFRPGKGAHRALEQLRKLLRPRERLTPVPGRTLPYQWAIEGDIKGCFDNIGHHALMNRLRRRIGDPKVLRLVAGFLKSGVMSEEQLLRSDTGTPQGGILSPLLANVALSTIEERYERHVWPRRLGAVRTDPRQIEERASTCRNHDRRRGRFVHYPIRYADDFIILIGAPDGTEEWQHAAAQEEALREKEALAQFLRDELGLELSESKTLVTPVTRPMRFLGHNVRVRAHPSTGKSVSVTSIPRDRSQRLRRLVKTTFARRTTNLSLDRLLHVLNPMLRGWAYFYCHAWGAKRVFNRIDHHVWWTIFRWLKKKHGRVSVERLARRYGWRKQGCTGLRWQDGGLRPFELSTVRVAPYMLWTQKPIDYVNDSVESPVRNERRTPGSVRGARKRTRR